MNSTLCVLLVYNDNGSVQNTLCIQTLHSPIVIINQQYTKGEIHFINIIIKYISSKSCKTIYHQKIFLKCGNNFGLKIIIRIDIIPNYRFIQINL